MIIYENKNITENSYNIKLNILTAGYAKVDDKWKDTVMNSSFSRMYFILKGSFKIISLSGEIFEFKENGIYIIPSGFSYKYSTEEEMEHVYFHFRLTSFGKIDLLKSCNRPVGISFDLSDREKYINFSRCNKCYDIISAQAVILSSLLEIISKNNISIKDTQYSFGVCQAVEYIKKNLSIQLKLEDVAKNVNLATSTLTRQFRRETGISVGGYIDNLIMCEAEEKLRFSNMSIAEISELYGFCDQFYFSRKFKETYGISPREYKKTTIM